jgi:hypothetical protein
VERYSAVDAASAFYQEDVERSEGVRARIAAKERCMKEFGAFLKRATTESELDGRLSMLSDKILATVGDVCDEYQYESVDAVAAEVVAKLKTACGCPCGGDCDGEGCDKEGCTCGKKEAAGAFCDDCRKWGDGCECSGDSGSEDSDGDGEPDETDTDDDTKEASAKTADGPEGASYTQTVAPETSIGTDPSPSNAGMHATGTEPKVDSKANPSETMDPVENKPSWSKASPDAALTTTQDPEKAASPQTDGQGGVFPKGNQAEPVTSSWDVIV